SRGRQTSSRTAATGSYARHSCQSNARVGGDAAARSTRSARERSDLACRPEAGGSHRPCKRAALWSRRSAELLGESDEKPFGPTDVAEPIRVLVLDDFAHELRAARAEPLERVVDVVDGEHDSQVAQRVYRGVPVIRDDRGREKPAEFEPAVTVRRAHHGDLDALIAQSSDTSRPLSLARE